MTDEHVGKEMRLKAWPLNQLKPDKVLSTSKSARPQNESTGFTASSFPRDKSTGALDDTE
ncbi:hypothetical protein [Rosistilla ulvae]|uniref:hypothetical protein n=1 Tax=Rosistilla ulvae TaxID=1930277 RepID=UPI0011A57E75|nr:hypothetical protein [Rosistilla ulvae]